jgi:hypothetical protein
MSRIEGTVIIKRPADKVFAYTTEAKSWPKWHGAIPEAEQTSKGQIGVGTTFRGKTRMMGQTSEWTAKMTEYEPYKRWGKVIDSGSLVIDDKLVCDPAEGGTRLTMVYEVKVGGILKLLSPVIISAMRKQLKLDLASLKGILETQA